MTLVAGAEVDGARFAEIRRTMELEHFKWDAQVGDVTALAPFPLLVDTATWRQLAGLAERLCAETLALEDELLARPELWRRLAVPRALRAVLASAAPTPAAARVMRFDFHFVGDGWRVSEVNCDVPGGFTEATHFTRLMAGEAGHARPAGDPTRALVDALASRAARVALVCAPWHMEDQQVVSFLAAELRARGVAARVLTLAQLRPGEFDAVVRFYQAEWLARLPRASWAHLFAGGVTPVANPGLAVLAESKRLPLVWDELRAAIPTWRALLPETRSPQDAPWRSDDGWLLKPAYGNTGDSVAIREVMPPAAWARVAFRARLFPRGWVAQRRFAAGAPCVGVYTVDGRAAGAYARLARGAIVDFAARDAALLVVP